jgi:hypothetical protein
MRVSLSPISRNGDEIEMRHMKLTMNERGGTFRVIQGTERLRKKSSTHIFGTFGTIIPSYSFNRSAGTATATASLLTVRLRVLAQTRERVRVRVGWHTRCLALLVLNLPTRRTRRRRACAAVKPVCCVRVQGASVGVRVWRGRRRPRRGGRRVAPVPAMSMRGRVGM